MWRAILLQGVPRSFISRAMYSVISSSTHFAAGDGLVETLRAIAGHEEVAAVSHFVVQEIQVREPGSHSRRSTVL